MSDPETSKMLCEHIVAELFRIAGPLTLRQLLDHRVFVESHYPVSRVLSAFNILIEQSVLLSLGDGRYQFHGGAKS